MSFRRNLLLCSTTLVGAALLAMPSAGFAQTAPAEPAAEEDAVEAVVVTGSRIRRNPTNTPTPLTQVGREEILQSGEANVIDYLADVPALQNSTVPEDTTGAGLGDGGLSLLNLRNLGTQRTLVLVDGRRHVGAAYFATSSVDVDTIPRLLIQDVEVITGGASAVYGADAVSGVVNFILRKDFEGLEVDGAIGQINQDGQINRRLSALAGKNWLDDRLNTWVSAEWEKSDEVLDSDVDHINKGQLIYQNDLDPSNAGVVGGATSDGVFDAVAGDGFASINRPLGGILTLANGLRPSPLSDPDIPPVACGTGFFNATCFVIDPGVSFVFNGTGGGRPVNFGTFRVPAGQNRTSVVGSPDALPFSAFQATRLPATEASRLQAGFNFEVNDNLTIFGDGKYIVEESTDGFQPAFFDIGITPVGAGQAGVVQFNALNQFRIGTDNAYLDPALRAAIESNVRTIYNTTVTSASYGQPTGTTPDARARFQNFTPELGQRGQFNTRQTQRYVIGARGDLDKLFFVNNFNWEVGYTFGSARDKNSEFNTVDAERYGYAADAVRDVNNVTGKGAGSIVCRVQLIAAQNGTVSVPTLGVTYTANDAPVRDCVPIRIFGQGGVSSAAQQYITTSQFRGFRLEQEDVLAFASGELWDLWGAGPIGISGGFEWREEEYDGRVGIPAGRNLLFANAFLAQPLSGYDVKEGFVEVSVPLLKDLPFAESVEVGGAYRISDYSSIGETTAWSSQISWRVMPDLLFRGTYGTSVRAPQLNELFQLPGQTFIAINDPCDANNIRNSAEPLRSRRTANCAAQGVPATYIDPNPTSTNSGFNGSNPTLQAEESTSFTLGTVLRPRFIPNLSIVVDYYSIDIKNAIANLTAAQLLQICYDIETPNQAACNALQRDPASFEITNFFQGPVNFAQLRARGVDFGATYRIDLLDLIERDWGRLDFSLRGTYSIRRENFTDPLNPGIRTGVDSLVGEPRVRARLGTTWSKDKLGVTWNFDYQTDQELFDANAFDANPDNRPRELWTTGDFWQHDFNVRYDLNDKVRLRAGVVNAFDEEPTVQAALSDQFDLFGRRYFIGFNYTY